MMEGELSHPSGAVGAKTDDLDKGPEADYKDNEHSNGNRTAWLIRCAVVFMMIAVLSLAIGLGLGMDTNDTTLSNAVNVTRSTWPELVGMDAEYAAAWMRENYPEYNVVVVNYGDYATTDYNTKRVRIYKSPNGTVYIVPKIGR